MFRTEINIPISENKFDYQSNLFFIGSCFTENIGGQMKESKFPVSVNPFGILYNPLSIAQALDFILSEDFNGFSEEDLHYHNEQWFSFYHHSKFNHTDKVSCLNGINQSFDFSKQLFYQVKFLFITFGTAYVYRLQSNNQVVANCHKLPHKEFRRTRLSVDAIVNTYDRLIQLLYKVKPDIKIVFTVSPIRHWKDGAIDNQLGKATLLVAIHRLKEKYPAIIDYFPAYEIMMDDLRDYRFYEQDMLHPNQTAIDYIWQGFKETYMDDKGENLMKQIAGINAAVNHRPFNPQSAAHLRFIKQTLDRIEHLEQQFPFLDFGEEKRKLNQ